MKHTITNAFIKDGRYFIAREAAYAPASTDALQVSEEFETENFDEETSDSGSDDEYYFFDFRF